MTAERRSVLVIGDDTRVMAAIDMTNPDFLAGGTFENQYLRRLVKSRTVGMETTNMGTVHHHFAVDETARY